MSTPDEQVILMGLFSEATPTADAVDALAEAGIPDEHMVIMTDVPYPEQALGRHREWLRLPYVVGAGALGGFLVGVFLVILTPLFYKISIGGKPLTPIPTSAIIIYVFTMMATIVSTFLGVLWEMEFPRFSRTYYDESVTDGNVGLLLACQPHEEVKMREILENHGAHAVKRPERRAL